MVTGTGDILKIAVIGPHPPHRGGISQYNDLLCRHLSKRHGVLPLDFDRMYPRILRPGPPGKEWNGDGKTIRSLDVMDPRTWVKTSRIAADYSPELAIFHWWTPFFAIPFTIIASSLKKLGFFLKISFS